MKTKGIYFLYRVLQAFALPFLLLYFAWRGVRNRAYWRSLPQRLGWIPHSYTQTGPGAIWLHAVSVGEVMACVEFLRLLRAALPKTPVYVSTSTLAGYATARDKLRDLAAGLFYAPADYTFAVRRVLRRLQPSVVVIAETEIWPNWFREAKRTGAGVMIVNGRISDRAIGRYRLFRWFFSAVLPQADAILAQTYEIRQRFVAIGAPSEHVAVAGNVKYDFEARAAAPDSAVVKALRGKVWIAASTMPPAEAGDVDEDDIVIAAARSVNAMLVLAPRKPERFAVVAQKLEAAGLPYVRRSSLPSAAAADVLLLDSIGELAGLFAYADVVFMGGTLARRGGHNILEPAFFGKPVIIGPHMENFRAIADEFRAAGACVEIAGPSELAAAVNRLLDNAGDIGGKALACANARRGATARAVSEVRELHAAHIPRRRPAMPWLPLLWLLSHIWQWGGRRKQAAALREERKLDVPVISIGNLTMGGTGKTPCVLRVAEILKERGHKPGILTRGYGRSSHEKELALAPGATVSAEHSGDEPQIFVRAGIAPVGIGADRLQAGRLLRKQFDLDVMLLDDGFQHVRLARNADVVLIDALNPLGGGGVFPLGRLREPPDALARAHIVVITRNDLADTAGAIEREVRRWNTRAPVFRSRVRPQTWVELTSGALSPAADPPFSRAAAFCGLGNPRSFRCTLDQLGIEPLEWLEYEDHHRYRPYELRRIAHHAVAAGADALLTTEKDFVNFCEDSAGLIAPLRLYWLRVAMEIEREGEFVEELLRLVYPGEPSQGLR